MNTSQDPDLIPLNDLEPEENAVPVSPAVADELSVGGSTPDPASDDDIDEIGNTYGVKYPDTQPLDISKKIQF